MASTRIGKLTSYRPVEAVEPLKARNPGHVGKARAGKTRNGTTGSSVNAHLAPSPVKSVGAYQMGPRSQARREMIVKSLAADHRLKMDNEYGADFDAHVASAFGKALLLRSS